MEIKKNFFDIRNYAQYRTYTFTGNPINKAAEEITEATLKTANDAMTSIGKAGINIIAQRAKVKSLKPDDLKKLIEQGKTRKEICAELGISKSTYDRLIQNFDIDTQKRQTRQMTKGLTKEKLEELLSQDKTLNEIARELGVSKATLEYHKRRLGIKSDLSLQKKYISSITREDILQLLSENKTREEICKELDISEGTYTRLLVRFNIETTQKAAVKRSKNISKEDIVSRLESNMPIMKICEDLGISWSTFKKLTTEYGIQTKQMNSLERNATITRKQLTDLIEQGLSRTEICARLGISLHTYNLKLQEFNIKSKLTLEKERAASITKEQIETLLQSEKTVDDICSKLGISQTTYSRLLHKFKLKGRRTFKISAKTEESFKKMLEQNKSKDEICEKLKISKNMYFLLCNQFGIKTAAKQMEEQAAKITKEDITSRLAKNMTVSEIIEDLGLSKAVYRRLLIKFDIKTRYKLSRENVANLDEIKFKELFNQGKSREEIKEILKISNGTYLNLLRKFGVVTSRKQSMQRIEEISAEDIKKLLHEKKSYLEIAEALKISPVSVYRLIDKYGLPTQIGKNTSHRELWGISKSYEQYTVPELKERLLEVFVENKNITHNKDIETFTDMICDMDEMTPEIRENVIGFVRLLDSSESNRIHLNEILKHPITHNLENFFEQITKSALQKENTMIFVNETIDKLIENLYQSNMTEMATICTKYKPQSIEKFDENLGQSIAAKIQAVLAKYPEEIPTDKLRQLVHEITYLKELHSNPNTEILLKAKKYATNAKGELSESKAGQYIINAKRYIEYLKTGKCDSYNQEYFKLLKKQLPTINGDPVEYFIKLDSWFNSELTKDNYLCEFLKIFDKENPIDSSFIEKFLKETYINIDTSSVVKTDKGAIVHPKILAAPKKDVFEKYKYPNCLEYLAAFEDGITRMAPPKGQSGIKIETVGLKRMKIKLIGYPDRMYSTKKDYVFDKFDPHHR